MNIQHDPPTMRTADGIAVWTLGDGPALLCAHGGPGTDHGFFRPYLDPLQEVSRLVYFDLPGHGQSLRSERFELENMAQAIESVRSALGEERVSLLGSSYGGFLSLLHAARHPETVESLILVDTAASHGFREESLQAARRRGSEAMLAALERLWDGSLTTDEEFQADWTTILPLYFHQLEPEEIRALAGRATYNLETRKRILATLAEYDVRERLGTIDAPALVIAGRHDWITSVIQAQELADGLPNSQLVVFEQSGHYPFIEEHAEFLRRVRSWLAGNVRPR